ncbi:MAG: hypothetical protein HQ541_17135 [Mariniphaga sp.]|nr:hypothetical protein [Mariniphaga sp.]
MMLILSHLLFSYYYFGGWWNSSVGTILILFFSYLIWKKQLLEFTGLKLNLKTIIISLILASCLIIFSYLMMNYLAGKHQVQIVFTTWQNYYHDVFYTLNEEIILGAILLNISIRRYKMNPILVSLLLALVFSIVHFVFYKWVFLERGIITISTIISLFLIGVTRNNIIITTKHIGYSWALHFSWMAIMFGSYHFFTETEQALTEYERFNLYLGSYEMLLISVILAAVSFWFLKKKLKFKN